MRCPECLEAGERSKVFSGAEVATLMSVTNFYDEDGAWHHHDPNAYTTHFRCSRDHSWESSRKKECSACVTAHG